MDAHDCQLLILPWYRYSVRHTCNWTVLNKLCRDNLPMVFNISAIIERRSQHWNALLSTSTKLIGMGSEGTLNQNSYKLYQQVTQTRTKPYSPTLSTKPPASSSSLTAYLYPPSLWDSWRRESNYAANTRIMNRLIGWLRKLINVSMRKKWHQHLDSCQPGSVKLWKTIKAINNNVQQTKAQAIFFYDNPVFNFSLHNLIILIILSGKP